MARNRPNAFLSATLSLFSLLLLLTGWTGSADLAQGSETVLLDFSSPTCGPCRQMRPVVGQLKAAGYPVREVDVLADHALAARYHITQVPAFVLVVDGREYARLIGATSYGQLEEMFHRAQFTPQTHQPAAPANQAGIQLASNTAPSYNPSNTTPQLGRIVSIQQPDAAALAGQPVGQPAARMGSLPSSPLLESAVRISVQDPDGNSTGTGTIIDARSGEALILTCGHLFRASGGQGAVTVTLFQDTPGGAEPRATLQGRLVDYDLERDLGLLSIRTDEPLRVAPIAPPGTTVREGDAVTSLGCNHGENPTAIATQVTALNRYQGPANVQAAIAPVEGRSGGGLLNSAGQLVGVCFAADPKDNEGLYSAAESVRAKLDILKLSMVYQSPSLQSTQPGAGGVALASADIPQPAVKTQAGGTELSQSFAVRGQEPSPEPTTSPFPALSSAASPTTAIPPAAAPTVTAAPSPQIAAGSLTASESALLEEIARRGADSEVICIIRPKTPNGRSEVITLNRASGNFLRALGGATARTQAPAGIQR